MCMSTDASLIQNHCAPDTDGVCHPNATCTQVTPRVCACNPASSYRCKCKQGFTGDGLICKGKLFLGLETCFQKRRFSTSPDHLFESINVQNNVQKPCMMIWNHDTYRLGLRQFIRDYPEITPALVAQWLSRTGWGLSPTWVQIQVRKGVFSSTELVGICYEIILKSRNFKSEGIEGQPMSCLNCDRPLHSG